MKKEEPPKPTEGEWPPRCRYWELIGSSVSGMREESRWLPLNTVPSNVHFFRHQEYLSLAEHAHEMLQSRERISALEVERDRVLAGWNQMVEMKNAEIELCRQWEYGHITTIEKLEARLAVAAERLGWLRDGIAHFIGEEDQAQVEHLRKGIDEALAAIAKAEKPAQADALEAIEEARGSFKKGEWGEGEE